MRNNDPRRHMRFRRSKATRIIHKLKHIPTKRELRLKKEYEETSKLIEKNDAKLEISWKEIKEYFKELYLVYTSNISVGDALVMFIGGLLLLFLFLKVI